jgi:hypothetical protein
MNRNSREKKARARFGTKRNTVVPVSPAFGRQSGHGSLLAAPWTARSAALATTDGRWALVSTSLTAMVAGAIALAGNGHDAGIVSAGRAGPFVPALCPVHQTDARAPTPTPPPTMPTTPIPHPGVESRTVTLWMPATRWRACWKMSAFRAQDANSVVACHGQGFRSAPAEGRTEFRPDLYGGHHRRHRRAAPTGESSAPRW